MRFDVSTEPKGTITELKLRRFRADELDPTEQAHVRAQLAVDGQLRAQLKTLADEQGAFEAAISLERFSGGVVRAQRDIARRRRAWKIPALSAGTMAFAAAAMFFVMARPTTDPRNAETTIELGANRVKGQGVGFGADVRVANAQGEQRPAVSGRLTRLAVGDRVRLGVRVAAGAQFFAAISADERGESSVIYPNAGDALKFAANAEATYLPDSFEFTGHGRETLFVFAASAAFDVNQLTQALGAAIGKGRHLDAVTVVDLPRIPGLTLLAFPFDKP